MTSKILRYFDTDFLTTLLALSEVAIRTVHSNALIVRTNVERTGALEKQSLGTTTRNKTVASGMKDRVEIQFDQISVISKPLIQLKGPRSNASSMIIV